MTRHAVATTDELPPGGAKRVTVAGRDIGLYNVGGEFFALGDRCPHEGAPLCRGKLVSLVEASEPGRYRVSRGGELVRCPWHGWEFDLRTGKSWCDPGRVKVRRFEVSVEDTGAREEGRVEGPYEVETFPVTVEKRTIVVEV